MDAIIKNLVDKISSYDIFNNLFPGIIFCIVVERTTRITFYTGEIWESLFFYYFVGMILSRIGSIYVEKFLRSIKVYNKETHKKEEFLKFAPYSDYIEASEANPFITILNETNNTYRTIVAMLITIIGVKLYDWLLYDLINTAQIAVRNFLFLLICLLLIMLFIHSYKKQTNYIRSRVKKYVKSKQTEVK